MITGFNTNYRHRGVLFHVQTEDSGRAKPRVVTHLFHGGNILASENRDYSDLLGADNVDTEVRRVMEGQHKSMLQRLKRGEHDPIILERIGPEVFNDGSVTDATLAPTPTAVEPEAPAPSAARPARSFGERVVSAKPLDEVVLDYLVENARRRKRSSK